MAKERTTHRGGVLQLSQQLEERTTEEPPPIRGELILEFCRRLIKNTWSDDVIVLSAYAARSKVGATDEEMAVLMKAVYNEKRK